jgi:hypothetical protein
LRPGNGVRKTTGTFYTPPVIATELTRRTLEPLVRNRRPEEILALKVLDPAMGSGAFLVAACSFLAQAYELALVDAGVCSAADLGPADRIAIKRTIAERCLFGVDLNPMAVQLARLSLWLATLAADKPLSFLDDHLQTGNSLLGTWLSRLRHAPSPAKRRATMAPSLFDDTTVNDALKTAMPARFSLATANDTADDVRAKERTLAALARADTPLARWKRIADLWCAPWFSTNVSSDAFRALSDYVLTGESMLPPRTTDGQLTEAAAVASRLRFFHWELEFPEVFFAPDGVRLPAAGFDAVLGNPPWDMLRADQRVDSQSARTERAIARSIHARGGHLPRAIGRSRQQIPSCSRNARWRCCSRRDESGSSCLRAWPPITAAPTAAAAADRLRRGFDRRLRESHAHLPHPSQREVSDSHRDARHGHESLRLPLRRDRPQRPGRL